VKNITADMNRRKFSFILLVLILLTPQVGAVSPDEAKKDVIKELVQDKSIENAELNYRIYVRSLEIIAIARSGLKEREVIEEYAKWLKSLQEADGSFPPIITFDVSGVPFCDAYYYAERPKGFESFPSCLYGFSLRKCPEYSYVITCSRVASTALVLYALLDAGEPKNSPVIKNGVQYLLRTMKNGTYWTYVYTISSSKSGYSTCEEAEKIWGFKETPSLVSTAYAIALLHRLGYDVSKPLEWLNSNFEPKNLMNEKYLEYLLENETSEWGYNFPFYQLGFPSVHFFHREPFESLVIPLVLIKEEELELNQNAISFVVSVLNKTKLSFSDYYGLHISVNLFWDSEEKYRIRMMFNGTNLTKIEKNGTFHYLLSEVWEFKAFEKNFTINGNINFTIPEEITWEPEIAVFLLKKLSNGSYMRVGCAEIEKCGEGCYNFKIRPHYDWWSDSLRPSVMALLWYYLSGETRDIGKFLEEYNLLGCESELTGGYEIRGCSEDYAMLLLLMDLQSGSFKISEKEFSQIKLAGFFVALVSISLIIGYLIRKRKVG